MSDFYWQYSSAHEFRKRQSEYNLDNMLSNYHIMDNFIHALAGMKIDNASGGAFRACFLGFYKDGVLLGSTHHSDMNCDIKIASNPEAKFIYGCQDSRCYGDPHPSLSEGKWVTVWQSHGRDSKIKDGPWVSKVKEVIQYAIDYAAKRAEFLIDKEAEEIKSRQLEKEKFENETNQNWAKVG